ncbi:hypothetical protein [Nocardia sp. NPDC059228]|uniref:hypothetical protein n=1 Tax=Nocardia sp. NPDC059228 TaxID=3346777 RepID=UPI0036AC1633
MMLPFPILAVLFVLAALFFFTAPSTFLAVVFLITLWALWRRRAHRWGMRR